MGLRHDVIHRSNIDPTVNDDSTVMEGTAPKYKIGDDWLNTVTNDMFEVFSLSAGNALWINRASVFNTVSLTNIITPPILTATADDYNPTGFDTANIIRQDVNTNNREITGFPAPPSGVNRIIGVTNINPSHDIRYTNNDGGSVAANRILLRDGNQKSSKPNETALFWYDHISLRWRPYNRVG